MRTIITLFAFIFAFATLFPHAAEAQLNILSTNTNVVSTEKTLPKDSGRPTHNNTTNSRNPNLGNSNNGNPSGNGHNWGNNGSGNGHGTNHDRPGRPNNHGHNAGHGHGHNNGNAHNGPTGHNNHGHNAGHSCYHYTAICDAKFEDLYHMVAEFHSSFDRMDILEKQIPRYYFTNCQIRRLANLFHSSFDRMDIMEIAFHQSVEQDSYHYFTDLFFSSFDKRDLLAYIDQHIHH